MKLSELRQLAATLQSAQGGDLRQRLQAQILALGMDPDNIYQELEMAEPYVETHRDISRSGEPMQLHSHVFYELLYCRSSGGTEYLVGSERYRLQRGDIVFVPPGVSHRPILPEQMSEPYERYVLWISPEFLEEYGKVLFEGGVQQRPVGMLRTGGTPWESLGELFRAGVKEAEQQAEDWRAAVMGNTILLLTQLKRAARERSLKAVRAEKPVLLDKLTAYIEAHYGENFTIDTLAKTFYVSGSTISHLFKEKMGVSFYRYVTQRRLIAGKSLIEKGMLLEDVAREAGFGDYSGFYRAFRQEYGISPRQYRHLQDYN